MDEASKMQALPLSTVRERLLSQRHDAFSMAQKPSDPEPAPPEKPAPAKAPSRAKAPLPERICAYAKCGVKFQPRRPDQHYHSADCRKRAWFDRNFAPIAKPPEGAA